MNENIQDGISPEAIRSLESFLSANKAGQYLACAVEALHDASTSSKEYAPILESVEKLICELEKIYTLHQDVLKERLVPQLKTAIKNAYFKK